ncbi:MAG TPA: PA14 domain-containing protein [Tepidisphaeraceae bacterium]|nr:PA14 domain-containing protein [Tepidisphaeraceae bacterium]
MCLSGGLTGQYFTGTDLQNLALTRVDPQVNFSWNHASDTPDKTIPHNNFSARWMGQVTPPTSGRYTFITISDDGVRLSINGQMLIDNWKSHPLTQNQRAIKLVAGQSYDIRLEYYQKTRRADMRLLWRGPQVGRQPIPVGWMTPLNNDPPPTTAPHFGLYSLGAVQGIEPMIRVYEQIQTPAQAADWAIPLLRSEPTGDRVIYLGNVLPGEIGGNIPTLIASGPNLSNDRAWVTQFFSDIKAGGADVDRVVLDCEAGIGFFSITPGMTPSAITSLFQSIYGNAAAYAALPASVTTFSPQDYSQYPKPITYAAINAWNVYAGGFLDNALRQGIVAPAEGAMGHPITISNFGDTAQSFITSDINGWLTANVTIANVSSPVTYLWDGQKFTGLTKDWRWNRLIDALNAVRSAANVGDHALAPWISDPGYRGDGVPATSDYWLWAQMVEQMAATGVTTFLYWNTGNPAGDAFTANLFAQISANPPKVATGPLAPIPYDADQIVTGDLVLTYSDFLKFSDHN